MDFTSLNRRQLQSLCKLNKIPANITNVAMADALKSLDAVVGIEEILNPSVESSKTDGFASPKVPCTSYRTSTWKKVKKSEQESLHATASRVVHGLRRQLAGEGNDFLKTPSVSGARTKGATTVQRLYNTRRSARLSEKKCTEAGMLEKEIRQSVKIVSFLEEASEATEASVGSGFSPVETSCESSVSFEITKDDVGEGSVENCDEVVIKAKVKDICNEFEKLDVIDGGDQSSVIEKVDFCDENEALEEKQKVDEKFKMNGQSDQVDDIKPYSRGISNPIETMNLEDKLLVFDEKVDPHEELNVLVMEENDCLNSVEHSVSLPCVKVLSETDGTNAYSISCDIENPSVPLASVSDVKNRIDLDEDSNVSLKTHNVYLALDEHSDGLFCDVVSFSDYFKSDQNSVIEKVECCGENVDLEGKQKVEEKINLNESEISEEKSSEIDNIKLYSEGISNPNENVDLEEKLMVVDKKTDPHEDLHALVVEQNDYMASEEHSKSLLSDKVLSVENETDGTNADSKFCDIENSCDSFISDVKIGIDLYEDLNVSLKTDNVYLALDENSDNLFCGVVLSSDYFEIDQNSVIEKADCYGKNVNLEEKQEFEKKFNLNESETSEEKSNKIDNIKPCSEGILNPHENVNLQEKLMVVDAKTDASEVLHVSVMEQNDYLASEKHFDSLLLDKVSSETDGTNGDSISCDTENQSDTSGSVSNVKNDINLYGEVKASAKTHNIYLALDEHSDNLFCDMVLSDAEANCADFISCHTENSNDFLESVLNRSNEILECNGNASELSKLDNAADYNSPEKMAAEAGRIEVNIFSNTVDDAPVNLNEQEPSNDFETYEEAYESMIKETAADKLPTIYQETNEIKADADKETHTPSRKNKTLNSIEVSDPNENNVVEDDKIFTNKTEDEKPISSNYEISMRQLKKQLKALSIKNSINTNKYDMVVEARPALQVVCDNHLTTGDEN